MGCRCSSGKRTGKVAIASDGQYTLLVVGLDNAGKTTLTHTINGGMRPGLSPVGVGFLATRRLYAFTAFRVPACVTVSAPDAAAQAVKLDVCTLPATDARAAAARPALILSVRLTKNALPLVPLQSSTQ